MRLDFALDDIDGEDFAFLERKIVHSRAGHALAGRHITHVDRPDLPTIPEVERADVRIADYQHPSLVDARHVEIALLLRLFPERLAVAHTDAMDRVGVGRREHDLAVLNCRRRRFPLGIDGRAEGALGLWERLRLALHARQHDL